MTQGGEVDRWMLSEMDRAAFEATATELVARLTDAVIDDAVRRLPPEWYAIRRERSWPRRSRSGGPGSSRRRGSTTRASTARWTSTAPTWTTRRGSCGTPDGRLEVALSRAAATEPWFRRTFDPRETAEVRLYLYGGADRVVTEGPAGGPITLRVVGGPGNDALDDSKSGGTRVYDFEGAAS